MTWTKGGQQMSRPLRKVSRFFKKNVGAQFNPCFVDAFKPGTLVDVDKGFELDFVDSLASYGVSLPTPKTAEVSLPNLARLRGLKFTGGLKADLKSVVPVEAGVGTVVDSSSSLRLGFGDAELHLFGTAAIDRAIRKALKTTNIDLEYYLDDDDAYVVTGSYFAPVQMELEKDGDAGFNFKAEFAEVADLDIDAGWKWRNSATLETAEPVLFALELAQWDWKKNRLISQT